MVILDRALGCLLLVGGVGHTLGSFHAYWKDPIMFL